MFMWHYFVIYFGCGLLIGFTAPKNKEEPSQKVSGKLYSVAVFLLIVLLILNFAVFGAIWALISLIEAFTGIYIAMMITGRNKSG